MSGRRIFVVTGANRGIGYGIVKLLAERVSDSLIYLTARDESLGKQAVSTLIDSLGSKRKSEIAMHRLDLEDASSIEAFASHLSDEHGGFDVLVNNAGMAFKYDATEPAIDQARVTIGVNYYGTKMLCDKLFPLLRSGGRVVNVCSQIGRLTARYSKDTIARFTNPKLTADDIESLLDDYKQACIRGDRLETGFPESAYGVSKAALIALTFIQADELVTRGINVNACCPGYVKTGMTSNRGHLTIEEGADTPVFLAASPEANDVTGKFYYLRKPIKWVE